jgi:hypothetical protein
MRLGSRGIGRHGGELCGVGSFDARRVGLLLRWCGHVGFLPCFAASWRLAARIAAAAARFISVRASSPNSFEPLSGASFPGVLRSILLSLLKRRFRAR